MKKVILATFVFASLAGCDTAPKAPASSLDSFDLCSKYVNGSMRYSSSDISQALMGRGENCQQYLQLIQARNQSSAAEGALGLQMLQQAQPKPIAQPPIDVRCQTRYVNNVAYTNCY